MLTNRTMNSARYRRPMNSGCGCGTNRNDSVNGGRDGMMHHHHHHDGYEGNACPLCNRPTVQPRMNPTPDNGSTSHSPCNPEGMTNCGKLLDQIRAVDFALAELVLYLDAYPHCREALDTYHMLIARRRGLCQQYETSCGPLTAMGNRSNDTWDWINGPFPWEYKAN